MSLFVAPAARRAWRSATTLHDLAELTAQWLEGRLKWHPSNVGRGGPDPETRDLVRTLAGLNRARLLTDCSQPGDDDRGWQQRAAITGYVADRHTHARITTAAQRAGLLTPAPTRVGTPVTLRRGTPVTWFGADLSRRDRLHSWGAGRLLGDQAQDALAEAAPITVIDPAYGPSTRLWDVLSTAVR